MKIDWHKVRSAVKSGARWLMWFTLEWLVSKKPDVKKTESEDK